MTTFIYYVFLILLTNEHMEAVDIDVVGIKRAENILTAFIYNANTKRSKDQNSLKIENVNATYPQDMDASIVEDLFFWDQDTKTFPFDLFFHFPAVKLLQVVKSFQEMEAPINGNFKGASRLEKVFITNQAFIRMGSNVFEGGINIKWIYLEHNSIQSIDEASFRGLKSLEKLSLQANRISSLMNETFSNLIELQFLNLQNNLITSINSKLFASNKKLKTILFDVNRLLFIASMEIPTEINVVMLNDNLCARNTFYGLAELNQELSRSCNIKRTLPDLIKNYRAQSIRGTSCDIRHKEKDKIVQLKDEISELKVNIKKLETEKFRLNGILEATSTLQLCQRNTK